MCTEGTSAESSTPYVILGGPPFETAANQTSMQMFDALSRVERSLYVCRRFQGSIVRRWLRGALGKTTTSMKPGLVSISENRFVLVLPRVVDFLPLVRPEWSRKLAEIITRRAIVRTLRQLGWPQPALISYWWMFPELVKLPIWKYRVFDVIDRHWGYSFETNTGSRSKNLDLAIRTAKVSQAVYAVSQPLVEELSAEGVSAKLLPNAVDLERVRAASARHTGLRENVAVYAGGWNDRLDVDLVEALVARNPTWQFRFLGSTQAARFHKYTNVKFLGDVPYETVLKELSGAKIGLIPFVINEFTEASNFLKVLDYLACGVSVGATNIRGFKEWEQRYPDYFKVCSSMQDWDSLFSLAAKHKNELVEETRDVRAFGTVKRAEVLAAQAEVTL